MIAVVSLWVGIFLRIPSCKWSAPFDLRPCCLACRHRLLPHLGAGGTQEVLQSRYIPLGPLVQQTRDSCSGWRRGGGWRRRKGRSSKEGGGSGRPDWLGCHAIHRSAAKGQRGPRAQEAGLGLQGMSLTLSLLRASEYDPLREQLFAVDT